MALIKRPELCDRCQRFSVPTPGDKCEECIFTTTSAVLCEACLKPSRAGAEEALSVLRGGRGITVILTGEAAPELLRVLKRLLAEAEPRPGVLGRSCFATREAARAIIAKAGGAP